MFTSVSLAWKWVSSMAVPKLRFKDSRGREFPKLKNGNLGDITVELKGTINPEDNPGKLYIEYSMPAFDNGKLPDNVYGKNMHSIRKVITEPCVLINKLNVRKQRIWLHNEFEEDAVCSTEFVALASNGLCSLEYINQLALTERFTVYLLSNSSGTSNSQQRVSPITILNYGFHLPSLPEQQKIADFLTAYDTMIDTQTKRVEAMKLRKKGLLQKIFSQEIRFKDDEGREFLKWEEKKLGEVCELLNGRAYSQPELLANGKYRVLRVGNFFTNGNWYYSDMELEAQKYAVTGDLLYAWAASLGPKIWDEEKVIYHYHIWKVVPSNGVSKMFLYHFLDNETKLLIRDMNGGTMKHITKAEMEKRNVQLPSLPEQQKIAGFLNAVDNQLEVEEKRLETMKTIKKGLLQQMFV